VLADATDPHIVGRLRSVPVAARQGPTVRNGLGRPKDRLLQSRCENGQKGSRRPNQKTPGYQRPGVVQSGPGGGPSVGHMYLSGNLTHVGGSG
jgi:hypothetical protein